MKLTTLFLLIPFFTFSQEQLNGFTNCYDLTKKLNGNDLGKHQVYWDTLIQFPKTTFEKPIKVDGFEFISPSQKVSFIKENLHDERYTSILEAPQNFLYQSNQLVGKVNNSKVYCNNYETTITNFGYDFYLKQHEVTNAEYREFIQYIKDSLFLDALSKTEPDKFILQGKELNWRHNLGKLKTKESYSNIWQQFMFGEEEDDRFYKRPQFNPKHLVYHYFNEGGKEIKVNVFPDTALWTKDFKYSWNEPMTQMYFWHPVYDNFPVVGISYNQIQAYLHWLQKRGIPTLDKKGIKYSIKLPNAEEIEFTTAITNAETNLNFDGSKNLSAFNSSRDFNTNLNLKLSLKDGSNDHISNKNKILSEFINPYANSTYINQEDGFLHTYLVHYKSESNPHLQTLGGEIFHLGSNVSEWIDATWEDYQFYFKLKAQTMALSPYLEIRSLGKELGEKITQFQPNYQLVMGANWFDEKNSLRYQSPLEGIYAKTFVNRDSAHSTVGFRYVIRIENPVNDKAVLINNFDRLNIFEALYSSGFTQALDSVFEPISQYDTLTFYNEKVQKEIKKTEVGVLDGVYIQYHSPYQRSNNYLKQYYPTIFELLSSNGFHSSKILTVVNSSLSNVVLEYKINFPNEYTLELIRL